MRDQRERTLRTKIIVAGMLALLTVALSSGVLMADERRSCWVEYAPGKIKDFRNFEDMDRGLNSRVVTYTFRRGSTVNQYYKDIDTAKSWMQKVLRQLRGCN